ncbi:MAG: NUDIX hydrolase [Caldiserica bacterium]|nr:NUDIX hydrolase [Caldisericota bacterium]
MGEYVFRGRLISVRVDETERGPREVVEHPGAVAILVLDGKGRVLMVRQHRCGAGRALWEIPAGTLEPGESPLRCAQRELWEETGLRAKRWHKLGAFYTSPGVMDELMHLFLAEGLEGDLGPQVEGEIAELRFRDPREVLEEVARGEPGDGKTLAALAFLLSRMGSDGETLPLFGDPS